jgi:multisubunit Na+/H+ antiporter MnhE subunit
MRKNRDTKMKSFSLFRTIVGAIVGAIVVVFTLQFLVMTLSEIDKQHQYLRHPHHPFVNR